MPDVALLQSNYQRLDSSGLWGISPASLFVNHSLLATHNPTRARSSVEGVFFKHSLRTCNNANPVNFIHRGASLGSLTFNLISYGADVEVAVNDVNRSHYIVVLPLTGRAAVRNHDEDADLESGAIVVLDPLRRFRFEMQPDHSHLAIGIPKQRLNGLLTKFYSRLSDRRWFEFQRRPYLIRDIGPGLLDFLEYICREIDRPMTITTRSTVASSIEETFLTLLVSTLLETDLAVPSVQEINSVMPFYIRKAQLFMEERLTEDINAEDIAGAAGVPIRTLYHTYRKCCGVSPMLWLKIRRLRQARLDLLDPAQSDISVTEVSHRYQQHHVGRFSNAYFQEFGEYPSATRKADYS